MAASFIGLGGCEDDLVDCLLVLMSLLCYLALNNLGIRASDDSTKITSQKDEQSPAHHNVSGNEWTNELLAWLFNNFLKVPTPLEAWIKSLNDAAKKVNKPTECEVIFDGFGDHSHVKTPPKLSNIRVEHGPREHLVDKTCSYMTIALERNFEILYHNVHYAIEDNYALRNAYAITTGIDAIH
ncbi:hypothetical protein KIN20_009899 [Parelaphostrongylus tenuis]|uniref:Uncharacterized protein n=1 Tax=Parelaphostrongylus tenuis TaxID=148309 RepID=A0AAD5MBS8_PARTN|nr:hypothetical protein KIN20_009899 [Parelaphostrongylus tenuis]